MKIEGMLWCEGPDCEAHERVGVPNMSVGRLPVGWVKVVEYGDTGPDETAYCGWNCVLKTAATIPTPEYFPFNTEDT